jgi:hypothetical protein
VAVIVGNMVILALVTDLPSAEGHSLLVWINALYLGVFGADVLVRFVGKGFKYFLEPWNVFDALVFWTSCVGQAYLFGGFYRYSEDGGTLSLSQFVLN